MSAARKKAARARSQAKAASAVPKQKDYVINLAPKKSRDGWVAIVDKVGLRIEAPSLRAAAYDAFYALRNHKMRLKLVDNVDLKLKVAARKRRAVEGVQLAYNATIQAYAEALAAQRVLLDAAQQAVELLREEGLSEDNLIAFVLRHHACAWSDEESDRLLHEGLNTLQDTRAFFDKARAERAASALIDPPSKIRTRKGDR